MRSFQFLRGPQVTQFESAFAACTRVKHCISTGNGTDGLFATIKMLGIKAEDEILVPAFTWITDSEIVSLCGAKPVFVDVDSSYYTIDPSLIEKKITHKTKALIVTHLFGQAADMSALESICKRFNLTIIEDCAQAHLTKYGDNYVGCLGIAGIYSFYPTKNLGAYGDAGCVVTNDNRLALDIRRFTNHGTLQKDDHEIEGFNSRMDTLQASIILAKLPYLQEWNEKRRLNAEHYNSHLKKIQAVTTPAVRPDSKHTFHIYAIRAKKRNDLKDFLADKGIETMIHYPKALPNLTAYKHFAHTPSDFPVSSLLQNELLSLPIYPELKLEEIEYVCEKIKDFYGK